jgi:hypothetical protein
VVEKKSVFPPQSPQNGLPGEPNFNQLNTQWS